MDFSKKNSIEPVIDGNISIFDIHVYPLSCIYVYMILSNFSLPVSQVERTGSIALYVQPEARTSVNSP